MWRTPSNIPDISSGQLGQEPARYASDSRTPSPSRSSYFYIQAMASGCGCSLTLAKILLISWCWSHASIRERAETNPRRQPPVDIHFAIVRPGTGGRSGMTSELGTMRQTTRRVSTTAAAAKTKTMSITVTTTMIGCRRDRFTLLIAVVETLFKVTKYVFFYFHSTSYLIIYLGRRRGQR